MAALLPDTPLEPVGSLRGRDVLVLSPTPTWPLDAGNRKRVHRICTELKQRGARIHFAYYPFEWWFTAVPQQAIDAMSAQWDSFTLLPVSVPLQAAPGGHHHHIDEWWDPAIEPMLQWLLHRGRYDAFIVNYPYLSRALELAHPRTLRILDTHDRFSGRREMLEQMGLAPEYFYTTADQEAKAFSRADVVWAIKGEEAEFFRTITDRPVITMPHIDDETPMPARPAAEGSELVLGMVGARNTVNLRNAMQFIDEVLPRLRRHLAPVRIRFGGGMCDDLARLDPLPVGVELAGRFGAAEEFYGSVDAVLVPMTFSTGLKIKAVEAFSLGLPIIAHRHAVEGIPVSHPFHTCSSPQELARCCIDLAFDRSLLTELREATRATYAELATNFNAAIADTVRRVVERPAIVMALAPEAFEADHWASQQFLETFDYLKHLGELILYADRPFQGGFDRWCQMLNWKSNDARIVFSPEAAAAMGLRADRRSGTMFPLLHSVESFASLRERTRHCTAWLMDLPADLREGRVAPDDLRASFLRVDSLRLLGLDQDLAALLTRYPGLQPVDCAGAPAGPADAHLPRQARNVPFWHRKQRAAMPAERSGPAWVLAGNGQAAWAATLAEVLATLNPQGLPPRCVSRAELPALMRDLLRPEQAPPFVVDATGGEVDFGILQEALERSGVPRIPALRGTAACAWNAASQPPATIETLVTALAEAVAAGPTQHQPTRRFERDAGWEWVWRTLSAHAALRKEKLLA